MKNAVEKIILSVLLVSLLSACGTPEAEQISDAPSTESVIQTETPVGTSEPSAAPTGTSEPTAAPTGTSEPTAAPTGTSEPSAAPTGTSEPSAAPVGTSEPTTAPAGTSEPTAAPTVAPTATPAPTPMPTPDPTPNASNTPEPSATPAPSVNVPSNNTDTKTENKTENKTETQAPEVTTTPEPTHTPSNTPNVSDTVREANNIGEAGSYVSDEFLANYPEIPARKTLVNKDYTVDQVMSEINSFVWPVYGRSFFENGVSLNYPGGNGAKILKTDDGTWGMQIISWRDGYDSSTATNMTLNVVLEGMRYLIGDAKVASALWRLVDTLGIQGPNAMTDEFIESLGFTLGTETSNSLDLLMNGHTIHWKWGGGDFFYFD